MTTQAFLPDIGFRATGTRLGHAVSVTRDGLTLTVRELVATPQGTDLRYDITDGSDAASCVVPRPGNDPFDSGTVVLRVGEDEFKGAMRRSVRVIPGGMRFILDCPKLPAGTRRVELQVTGGQHGDWLLPIDLEPFSADDSPMRDVDASAIHEDITVRVNGIARSATSTAVSFAVSTGTAGAWPSGAGGLHGRRYGSSLLRLRDDKGHDYEEIAAEDLVSRDVGQELAVFGPLPEDVRELELEIPMMYVSEELPPVDISLPVTEPVEAKLGTHPFRVLSTGPAPDSRRRQNFGPALSIALEIGAWQGDRRLLFPGGIKIDGQQRGMGYGNGINAADPKPVDTLEVRPEPESPKVLTLSGGTIQVRGPWRVRFAID